ncbi:MAG TPA: sugar phosphate isomerase/epimerase family protein [Rubrobacter sp.]
MSPSPPDPSRLSLNQKTTNNWSVREAAEGCARAGIGFIGLWRDKVSETGLSASSRVVREAGLQVSSLCRGGMFPAVYAAERRARLEDNRRAAEEAAALGTDVLVLVCGPAPERDLEAARVMVEEGINELAPYAAEVGVKLAIEPFHPVLMQERSVIVTLSQALDIAERFEADRVGVIVDAYHVWWDPDLYRQISRASGRIFGFHANDWLPPKPDLLLSRAMMGDGPIEIRRIREAVDAAGYAGPIEVEIFNQDVWNAPGDEVLALTKERYLLHA